jgi:hypothetical protein
MSQSSDTIAATNDSIRKQMEGLRTSYFMNWLLPKWGADPKRLESVSVCEIVEEYIAEMLKSSSSPQNAQGEARADSATSPKPPTL